MDTSHFMRTPRPHLRRTPTITYRSAENLKVPYFLKSPGAKNFLLSVIFKFPKHYHPKMANNRISIIIPVKEAKREYFSYPKLPAAYFALKISATVKLFSSILEIQRSCNSQTEVANLKTVNRSHERMAELNLRN